jgi:toxin FitB
LIVLDSSAWIEFFGEGPFAEEFGKRLRQPANVLTAAIAIYEVYKWLKRERSEAEAVQAVATMQKTHVVDITKEIAVSAADLSLEHKLAMADSMMLAVAQAYDAELLTTDSDFEGIANVSVFSKKS